MADPVRIVFLGGLGEIGRNCACIEVDGRIMLLDCGLMFPEADMPGIDLVLPDFTYLHENARIASRAALLPTGTRTTSGGCRSYSATCHFPSTGPRSPWGWLAAASRRQDFSRRTGLVPVRDGERRVVGPFDLEFIPVTHSVPYAFATAFHTPQGVILHSGDFSFTSLRSTVAARTCPEWR